MPCGSAVGNVLGRRRGAAAGPVPLAGMCLVTPGWRGDTRTGQGDSNRWGLEEPRTQGTLLCHPSRGPAFARCFPRGCGSCLTTDLWMFAHSCSLMCLGTKSCGMQHRVAAASCSALPGWKSAPTPAGRTHTHTHQHPNSTGKLQKAAGAPRADGRHLSPPRTGKPSTMWERSHASLGRQAGTLPTSTLPGQILGDF